MNSFTLIILGGVAFSLFVLLCIWKFAFREIKNRSNERRNRTRMRSDDTDAMPTNNTNSMPTNQRSSRTANNIVYPEHVDPVPKYSPPDESSHVIIPIPPSEPNSTRTQMPSQSQEPIDSPPTYRV
jgi:FtsZ-interacting cell division protein ZipA